jgi:hypothetical protein
VCVGGVGDGVGGVVVLIVSIMLASLAIVFDNACVVFGVLFRWRRCVCVCVCVCVGVVVGVCVCVCVGVVVRRRRCVSAASVTASALLLCRALRSAGCEYPNRSGGRATDVTDAITNVTAADVMDVAPDDAFTDATDYPLANVTTKITVANNDPPPFLSLHPPGL